MITGREAELAAWGYAASCFRFSWLPSAAGLRSLTDDRYCPTRLTRDAEGACQHSSLAPLPTSGAALILFPWTSMRSLRAPCLRHWNAEAGSCSLHPCERNGLPRRVRFTPPSTPVNGLSRLDYGHERRQEATLHRRVWPVMAGVRHGRPQGARRRRRAKPGLVCVSHRGRVVRQAVAGTEPTRQSPVADGAPHGHGRPALPCRAANQLP